MTHPVANYVLYLEEKRTKPSKLQQAASTVGRRKSGLQVVMDALNGTANHKG